MSTFHFSFIFLQFLDKLNSINVWVFIHLQRLNFTLYVHKFFFFLFFPNNKIKHRTTCLLLRFNTYIKCRAWWLTIGNFECMNNVMIFVIVMHVCWGAWHGIENLPSRRQHLLASFQCNCFMLFLFLYVQYISIINVISSLLKMELNMHKSFVSFYRIFWLTSKPWVLYVCKCRNREVTSNWWC